MSEYEARMNSDDELKGIKRCPFCGNIIFRMPRAMIITGIAPITCGCGQKVVVHADGTVSELMDEG